MILTICPNPSVDCTIELDSLNVGRLNRIINKQEVYAGKALNVAISIKRLGEEKLVIVVDPMLATGGSACDAITNLKAKGCKHIKFMAIIGAPEGIERVAEAHPDVDIYVSTVDRCLNEDGYILPGLGDAGDRLFGTK